MIKMVVETIEYVPLIFYKNNKLFYFELKTFRLVGYFETLFSELLSYFTKLKIKCN